MSSTSSIQKTIRRKTITSFTIFFLLMGAGFAAWKWLYNQPLDGGIRGGIQEPLRTVLNKNEKIFSSIFDSNNLVKEYPKSAAVKEARVNGDVGMDEELFDAGAWLLYVIKKNGDTATFTLNDIRKLKKIDVVHNFKCIEGWSEVTWWSGVRLSDFLNHYQLNEEANMKYVGMMTPDEEYYVGIDMPSALHPQTILCYELNGKPLPMNQGYPLRLIIPVKYGVKNIKRIGTIYFDNERPADYWAERGYDYFGGL
jgi:hypothetical protein